MPGIQGAILVREIVNDAVNDVVDIAHCINFVSGVDRGAYTPHSTSLPVH